MATRRLLVVLYDAVIGRIDQRSPASEPEFTYEPTYLESGTTPLGIRMPVADTNYRGKVVQVYLEGLLPEDPNTRARWGIQFSIDPTDAVAVLSHMGWDCPGGVQFCHPDELGEMRARVDEIVPVDTSHIASRLKSLRAESEASWTLPDERWSLAGQQSKIALRWQPGAGWHEAHGSAATTHIIKPGIGRLHHQALVEHATMQAARTLGLGVARSEFIDFDGEPAIVVERYDRLIGREQRVLRVHQEDFCSASGRLPVRKYEEHGGPTLADMVRIVDQNVRDRSTGTSALGDFAAFNYVAGAPDGHSKNISLLLLPGETRVAPLYDLASGFPYSAPGPQFGSVAVSIGGRRKFGQVLGRHWDRAARVLGVPAPEYRERVRALATGFPDAFSAALDVVSSPEAATIRRRSIDRIAEHISGLVERLDDPEER